MSAFRRREAGRAQAPRKAIFGARGRTTVALTGILLAGATVPACAAGGVSIHPDYLAMLPANVQKIVSARCSGPAHPRQYFATYFRNSVEMHLHYDKLSCDRPNRFCTLAGCLQEVYAVHGNSYKLSRSYYARESD
jgi:hypothetical protein